MALQELAALSQYYGRNPDYVVAGGGNTSYKDALDAGRGTLYIKGSGAALASIRPEDFVRLDRSRLNQVWTKTYPKEADAREAAVLAAMMDARVPGETGRPSVETLLHAGLPFTYVVHLHPALVNGVTCSVQGEAAARKLFDEDFIWIPLVDPGYVLASTVKKAADDFLSRYDRNVRVIWLQNHGIFVAANTVEEIRSIYDNIMGTLAAKVTRRPDFGDGTDNADGCAGLAAMLASLAGNAVVKFHSDNEVRRVVKDRAAWQPVSSAFTPDHIVYSGSNPLFVENPATLEPAWKAWVKETGHVPKIVALQGCGVFGIGQTEAQAVNALLLFRNTLMVAAYSEAFGGPLFMSKERIDFINNWEVERYRSSVAK